MKSYKELEERVAVLEKILREAVVGPGWGWMDAANAALKQAPEVVSEGVCKCGDKYETHALSGLCCAEGCSCFEFTKA